MPFVIFVILWQKVFLKNLLSIFLPVLKNLLAQGFGEIEHQIEKNQSPLYYFFLYFLENQFFAR